MIFADQLTLNLGKGPIRVKLMLSSPLDQIFGS